MKKTIIFLFCIVISISGCSNLVVTKEINNREKTLLEQETTSLIDKSAITTMPLITLSPEPSATHYQPVSPEKPKYIFYIIGDGMGYAHLLLGNIYEKILHNDWAHEAYWDSFSQQRLVEGCGESSSGGTALATGYITKEGLISQTPDGDKLYTIMDRAEDNGYATGVISNASLTDATPATFISHASGRSKSASISEKIAFSGIDYLAGGGMKYILSEDTAKQWNNVDLASRMVDFKGASFIMEDFLDQGYTSFWGTEGINIYNSKLDTFNVNEGDKLLALFETEHMLFQSYKYKMKRAQSCASEPDLDEMTQDAINFLSKDEDGFILMIEQALIDKSCHYNDLATTAQEMHMMEKTLETVFDFYYDHPDETLIVMTADHETGYLKHTDEAYNTILKLPLINWYDTDYKELGSFLVEECDVYVSAGKLRDYKETGVLDLWGDDDEDYALLHGIITEALCENYGIYSRSDQHSGLPVPCYSEGVKADVFAEVEHISDIPKLLMEIMGWRSLPEINE